MESNSAVLGLVAPRGAAKALRNKFPHSTSQVLRVQDGFNAVTKLYDWITSTFDTISNAAFVRYLYPDGTWTLWLPTVGPYGAGEKQLTILQHLMDQGWVKFIMQDRSRTEIYKPTFMEEGWAQVWNARLSQKKKRKWGLFVPTRHRTSRHRGPKRDRLCLRVPHL